LGKGTTFQIFLPLDEARSVAGDVQAELPALGTERILFVDDEPMVANLAVRSLGRLGYRVTPCTSSVDALERFTAAPHEYDLLVTDMTMPHMTGDQLAAAIQAVRPGIPIVLCTGFSDKFTAENARALGVDELTFKPVAGAALSRIIRRVLSAKAAS
jgi:CheY-like chemotaxis protein